MTPTTLTQLGAEARPAASPDEAVLETVPYTRRDGRPPSCASPRPSSPRSAP